MNFRVAAFWLVFVAGMACTVYAHYPAHPMQVGGDAASGQRGAAAQGPRPRLYNHLLDPLSHAVPPDNLKALEASVPGFDLRGYGEWILDLYARNAREVNLESDSLLQGLIDWQFEYFNPMRGVDKAVAVAELSKTFGRAAEVCGTWGNAFVVERDESGTFALRQMPRKDALAGLENQPFVFLYRRAGYDGVPVLKETSCDLQEGGAIRVRIDPQYSTLVRLALSGIRPGSQAYPLSLLSLNGEVLCAGEAVLRGVEPARVKVRIVDAETGKPAESLAAFHTPAGCESLPSATPFHIKNFRPMWRRYDQASWPIDDSRVHIIKGEFSMPVLPGTCRLIAARGPEYLCLDETFEAPSGTLTEKTFALRRFIDLPKQHWWSGDDHCHIDRSTDCDEDIMDLLAAVQLNVTNILQAGDDAKVIFVQDRWGELSQLWREDHLMVTGQEDPRTPWRGHTLIFNIQDSIHDRTSYYVYEDAFKEARRQGGITGYAHSATDFQAELGATVSVPLDLLDFIELDSADALHRDVIYHFWNLGYPIVVSSGSDFPWSPVPGYQRFYTCVDGPLNYEQYVQAFRAGRTFVSKGGAFLDVRVNTRLPGSVIQAAAGDTLRVSVRADLNPQYDAIDRVEIVCNGAVVETLRPAQPGDTYIEREVTVPVRESAWLAGRLFGKKIVAVRTSPEGLHPSCAHTNPFWLEVDGQPFLKREGFAEELARAHKCLDELVRVMDAAAPPINPELLRTQRPRLDAYIEQARAAYARLRDRAPDGAGRHESPK